MKTRTLCLFAIALAASLVSQALGAASEPGALLKHWQPMDSKALGTSKFDTLACAHFSTAKPLAEVWTDYASRLGFKGLDKPPVSYGKNEVTPADGSVELSAVSTKDRSGGTRAATLIRRATGQTIIIHLSADAANPGTLVSVVAEMR